MCGALSVARILRPLLAHSHSHVTSSFKGAHVLHSRAPWMVVVRTCQTHVPSKSRTRACFCTPVHGYARNPSNILQFSALRFLRNHASASSALQQQDARHKEEQKRELTSVNTALLANSLIFVAKTTAWFFSGGSALLAEAIHSLADVGNQAMLRVGILRAAQAPTPQYPFGHMREKFIFSLISAVGIFCLGAGVSIVHGIHAIAAPVAPESNLWGLATLCLSAVVESATLVVATRAVLAGARSAGVSLLEFVKSGRDPVSVAIMAEDGAAVAGVVIAAVCTSLVEFTGSLVWDGIGSVLVGVILAGVAIFLIQRNCKFLIGRSMKPEEFQKIVRHLKRDPVIKNIYEAKSEEIGEGIYRFNAEIDFHGPNLLERYMTKKDVKRMRSQFSRACSSSDPREFENIMKAYGAEVVSLVGAQVDRIEAEVMQLVPGVRYVDLETDRGRFSAYVRTAATGVVEEVRAETFQNSSSLKSCLDDAELENDDVIKLSSCGSETDNLHCSDFSQNGTGCESLDSEQPK